MITVAYEIPPNKVSEISREVERAGGKILGKPLDQDDIDLDNKVDHSKFFGENLRRLIKAFSK